MTHQTTTRQPLEDTVPLTRIDFESKIRVFSIGIISYEFDNLTARLSILSNGNIVSGKLKLGTLIADPGDFDYLGTLMVIPVGWENVKVFLRYMYLTSFQEDSAWSVVLAEFQLVSELSEGSSKLADSDASSSSSKDPEVDIIYWHSI